MTPRVEGSPKRSPVQMSGLFGSFVVSGFVRECGQRLLSGKSNEIKVSEVP